MKRRPLFIAANWKMHEPPVGSCLPDSPYRSIKNVEVCVFPSFLDLHVTHAHGLLTGAQCGHPIESGAYTGDISMKMLADQKVNAVLCGHSERRRYHHETDGEIAEQVTAALKVGLTAILCIGETAEERDAKKTQEVLRRQLSLLPTTNSNLQPTHFLVAYEPVWAIGTGRTPTPTEVQELHVFIRSLLPEKDTRILYGGSVDASNAAGFLGEEDVDGLLVGGASLDPAAFRAIVAAATAHA